MRWSKMLAVAGALFGTPAAAAESDAANLIILVVALQEKCGYTLSDAATLKAAVAAKAAFGDNAEREVLIRGASAITLFGTYGKAKKRDACKGARMFLKILEE